jgi:high frequency lysogenization protein
VSSPLRSQAVALSAICQAALLVHRVANGLTTNSVDAAPLTSSIFATDPRNVDEVYGGPARLRTGVSTAIDLLRSPSAELAPVLKYVMALLDLETRLRKRADLTRVLRSGIDDLRANFQSGTADLFEPLSSLYQSTISQLDRRIHVVGSAELLQQPAIAAKIRTFLLAGVRGARLWQQSGGRRWHLVLRRSTIRSALAELAQPTMIH